MLHPLWLRALPALLLLYVSPLAAQRHGLAMPKIILPDAASRWDTLNTASMTLEWVDSSGRLPLEQVLSQPFAPFRPIFIPKVFDEYKRAYWLGCHLFNASAHDTAHFYLYAGRQYLIEVYKSPDFSSPTMRLGSGIKAKQKFMEQDHNLMLISLPPKDSALVFIKIKPFTSLSFSIEPLIINRKNLLPAYLPKGRGQEFVQLFSAVLLGIIGFLILFTLVQYLLNKTSAYLYYILYLSAVFIMQTRQVEIDLHLPILFYWKPMLLLHGHMLLFVLIQIGYVYFVSDFLSLRSTMPKMHWFYKRMSQLALVLLLPYSLAVFLGKYEWAALCFLTLRVSQLWILVYSVFRFLKSNDPLSRLIGVGLLLMLLANLCSLSILVWQGFFPPSSAPFPFFFSLCGFLAEVVMFSAALGIKSVMVEKEKESARLRVMDVERNLLAAQVDLLGERTRISRDLHDDLGSEISSLGLSAFSAARSGDAGRMTRVLEQVSAQSSRLVEDMRDLIWSMNPENDTLEKMLARVRQTALRLLDEQEVSLKFDLDPALASLRLTPEVHRQLFLMFKESLNNLAKYARCRSASVSIRKESGAVAFEVSDDGVGFDPAVAEGGNGLRNLKERAAALHGSAEIESEPGLGTLVRWRVPLG